MNTNITNETDRFKLLGFAVCGCLAPLISDEMSFSKVGRVSWISIFCRPRNDPRVGTEEEDGLRRGLRTPRGHRLDELQQRPGRVQVGGGSEGVPVARGPG